MPVSGIPTRRATCGHADGGISIFLKCYGRTGCTGCTYMPNGYAYTTLHGSIPMTSCNIVFGATQKVKLAGVVASAPAATPASTGGAAEALRDRQLALIATLEASLAKVDAEVSKLGGTPGAAAGGGSAAGKMVRRRDSHQAHCKSSLCCTSRSLLSG